MILDQPVADGEALERTQGENEMSIESPKVMVILPTYNERENVRELVDALFGLDIRNFHLLIVDDNSPDGTGKIAEEIAQRQIYRGKVNVLHRPQKQGLGPAYIAGYKRALALDAQLIIQMDADFSHQPKYIPQLLEQAATHDVVVGSRYVVGGSVDDRWGPIRKLLSWWANRLYTPSILGIPVRDTTGGFRLFHRDCLVGLDLDRIKANGYVFQVEVIYVMYKLGYRIKEIPIHFPDRERGVSKMSPSIAGEAALRVLQIMFRHRDLSPIRRRMAPCDTE
ncbi:MAG: polyprenol monophosphomannose synthase [Chloroflexi bacterium]|nr:polyprenol monophosphomannose synthase [Chloroflexota bacterium]